jgi:hypothetical protein
MPTLAFSGAVQRSDTANIVDLFTLAPSLAVTEDSVETISLAKSPDAGYQHTPSLPFTTATFLVVTSDQKLSIVFTTAGGSSPAITGKQFVFSDTNITGLVISNTSITTVANVRIVMGGA